MIRESEDLPGICSRSFGKETNKSMEIWAKKGIPRINNKFGLGFFIFQTVKNGGCHEVEGVSFYGRGDVLM